MSWPDTFQNRISTRREQTEILSRRERGDAAELDLMYSLVNSNASVSVRFLSVEAGSGSNMSFQHFLTQISKHSASNRQTRLPQPFAGERACRWWKSTRISATGACKQPVSMAIDTAHHRRHIPLHCYGLSPSSYYSGISLSASVLDAYNNSQSPFPI